MKLFLSYRHIEPDIGFCERLMVHLATAVDEISPWADTGIEPGDDWKQEIEQAIEAADVGVLLVSADFLGSPFIKNVEIPMLVAAHKAGRLRLVPMFAGPTAVLPSEIEKLQGANTPGKPLAGMTRARREAVYADFVNWLHQHCASPPGPRPNARSPDDAAVDLERAPAAGLLFDRAEIRQEIGAFFSDQNRRICIVHGLHGVGKTTLAAKLVEDYRDRFTDVFWVTGRSSERSGLMLLGRLDALLRRNGDESLRGFVRHRADPEVDVEAAFSRAVEALTRVRYLLVFDELQAYLDNANALVDDLTRRLLNALSRAAGSTKVLVLSNRRPVLEQGSDLFPTGAALEHEVVGLPADSVGELLVECGLIIEDAGTRRRIATHFSGNPAMIKVYCSYVSRHRRDPIEALSAATAGGPYAALLGAMVGDLDAPGRDTLERIAVLRTALDWRHLDHFGLVTDDVVSLLDAWLVVLDPTSQTIVMPPVIRQFAFETTEPGRLRAAHLRAAEGYERLGGPVPRRYDDVRPILEAGHHRIGAGDVEAGAMAILDAVEFLIRLGYADLASDEIGVVEAHTGAPAVVARCRLQSGRILDRQGRLDDAELAYQAAATLARDVGDERVLANALSRIGRIHNARSKFVEAERYLTESIDVSMAAGLDDLQAAARLALAWGRKEQGAPDDEVVAAFEAALALAVKTGDHATASDAHRQLGFISWIRFHDRTATERHYDTAQRIATENSLAKEVGAIHKELAYLTGEWGDFAAADRHMLAAIEAGEGLRDHYLLPGAYVNEALNLIHRGDLAGAETRLVRSVDVFAANGNHGGEAYALHELGTLEAKLGRRVESLEHLERARCLSADHNLTLQLRAVEATIESMKGFDPA